MAWPYKSTKSIAPDRSYVDFLHSNADGSFSGLRLRGTRCLFAYIDAEGSGAFAEGPGSGIPMGTDADEKPQRERGMLAEDFPELERVLSGDLAFRDLFGPNSN